MFLAPIGEFIKPSLKTNGSIPAAAADLRAAATQSNCQGRNLCYTSPESGYPISAFIEGN